MKVPKPCRYCMNHPINGGSGICHCILGSPIIYVKESYNQTWDDEDDVENIRTYTTTSTDWRYEWIR